MEIINFLDGRFKYDDDGQFIWLVDSEGKLQKIADLRGWGAIQNLFKGDKGIIDSDKASKFQDAIGEWIVNALNSKLEEEKQDHKKDIEKINQSDIISWVDFDWNKLETRPKKYGKYLICRKDGKVHWETWNGSGWAYNHNEIRYWAVIVPPSSNYKYLKIIF